MPVVAAIDAKHGNLYLQMVGAGGRTLIAPRAVSLREAIRAITLGPVRIVGTAAAMLAAHWPKNVPPPLLVDERARPRHHLGRAHWRRRRSRTRRKRGRFICGGRTRRRTIPLYRGNEGFVR